MSPTTRTSTTELSEGLGRFRWADSKAEIEQHLPEAEWRKVEPLYAFKKAYWVEDFEVAGANYAAVLVPDTGDRQRAVRLLVKDAAAWPAFAALVRELGFVADSPAAAEEEPSWERAGCTLSLRMETDFFGVVQLVVERPLEAAPGDDEDPPHPLDDSENFDFED